MTDAKVGILDKAERVAHMPPAYPKKAENLSYFLAPDAVCRIPDMLRTAITCSLHRVFSISDGTYQLHDAQVSMTFFYKRIYPTQITN